MSDSKVIEKIQKLLALAGSGNENEARAALAKAQELMIQHQLDAQTISGHVAPERDPVAHERRTGTREVPWRSRFVDVVLQRHFKVRVVYQHAPAAVNLVGRATDVAVALYVRAYLLRTYEALFRAYKREHRGASAAAYFTGLNQGLSEVLDRDLQHAVTERALVVRPDPALRERVRELFGRTRSLTQRDISDGQAVADGTVAGRQIVINRGVEGDAAQPKQLGE